MSAVPKEFAPDSGPVITRDHDVVRVRLNRPSQHNRIDPSDIPILSQCFQDARNDRTLRGMVITGTGSQSFCSGYTLQAIATQLNSSFSDMLDTLESLPFVTIAAMAGGVYGGGTDLALCCDIRIGTPTARMFMPAAKFGLHYYPSGMRRYVERLGLPTAQKLFLTGCRLEAPEMLRCGFLTDQVEFDALGSAVERYLHEIRATEPNCVAMMKRNLHAIASGTVDWNAVQRDYESSLRCEALHQRLDHLLKQ